ncbi:MAG: hypothetical protein ACREN2_02635 [Candidatus Dormibacteria bacterium]
MSQSPSEEHASSSLLKYSWAHHHLVALKEAVDVFEKGEPAVMRPEFKPKRPGYDFRFHVLRVPQRNVALMAGDVVGCLRDALDHLIYELTVHYSGIPDEGHKTAWPICEYRNDWAMRSSKGRISKRAGERKVHGIHPKAQAMVYRLQPFYMKRSPGPHRRHPLWILDELRNIDRHRRLSIVAATSQEFEVMATRHNRAITIVRRESRRGAPKDGAVVERIWLTPGAVQRDMTVEAVPSCKLVIDETSSGQSRAPLMETMEALARHVRTVLANFLDFEPDSVQQFVKGEPWVEV